MHCSSGTKARIDFHQRAFAGGGTGLQHHGQRRFQAARYGGDVADLFVGFLAHHAATLEVFQDAIEQTRVFQQIERRGAVLVADGDLGCFRLQRFLDLLVLQFLQLAKHVPQVVFDGIFFQAHLDGGLLDEHGALAGRVQVERIDMEAVAASGHQIHSHDGVAEILCESAHPIAAVAQRDGDLFALHFDRDVHRI